MGLAGVDGRYNSEFTSQISSGDTFSGTSGGIAVSSLVTAMSGFEQQNVKIEANSGELRGTFSISYHGESTEQLDYNISAADIETALENLPLMGDVIVRRQNHIDNGGGGFTVYVLFVQQLGNTEVLGADITKLYSTDGSAGIFKSFNTPEEGLLPIFEGGSYLDSEVVELTPDEAASNYVYTIPGLNTGLNYHVRVSAWNGVANIYGNTKGSYPAVVQPHDDPSFVSDVSLSPVSDTSLEVKWSAPTSTGAANGILKYVVEYDVAPSATEVQTVTLTSTGNPTGTFCLAYEGFSTSAIPWDASESRVESALQSISTIGNVGLSKVIGGDYSTTWTVSFLDNVGDIDAMSISCNH
jgi:hypothetical protein